LVRGHPGWGTGKLLTFFYSVGRNAVPRRRITVTSSSKEISMEHLGYFVVVREKASLRPPPPFCAEGFWIYI
jgi:hypothetical protein